MLCLWELLHIGEVVIEMRTYNFGTGEDASCGRLQVEKLVLFNLTRVFSLGGILDETDFLSTVIQTRQKSVLHFLQIVLCIRNLLVISDWITRNAEGTLWRTAEEDVQRGFLCGKSGVPWSRVRTNELNEGHFITNWSYSILNCHSGFSI